jgi:hypothetical protein
MAVPEANYVTLSRTHEPQVRPSHPDTSDEPGREHYFALRTLQCAGTLRRLITANRFTSITAESVLFFDSKKTIET